MPRVIKPTCRAVAARCPKSFSRPRSAQHSGHTRKVSFEKKRTVNGGTVDLALADVKAAHENWLPDYMAAAE